MIFIYLFSFKYAQYHQISPQKGLILIQIAWNNMKYRIKYADFHNFCRIVYGSNIMKNIKK